jgi:putative ABC transport system substrate-binding protein
MNRRDLITLLGSAAAWPVAALAEQPILKVPRIGIIDDMPLWDNCREGLRELGYIEGRNIGFVYRATEGKPDRLAASAAELARLPVNIIASFGSASTHAAMLATTTIPIVMVGVGDPVGADLVASLSRPGGNVTGNTVLSADIIAKRLQLLQEAIPTVARVALLLNPDNGSIVLPRPGPKASVLATQQLRHSPGYSISSLARNSS